MSSCDFLRKKESHVYSPYKETVIELQQKARNYFSY